MRNPEVVWLLVRLHSVSRDWDQGVGWSCSHPGPSGAGEGTFKSLVSLSAGPFPPGCPLETLLSCLIASCPWHTNAVPQWQVLDKVRTSRKPASTWCHCQTALELRSHYSDLEAEAQRENNFSLCSIGNMTALGFKSRSLWSSTCILTTTLVFTKSI